MRLIKHNNIASYKANVSNKNILKHLSMRVKRYTMLRKQKNSQAHGAKSLWPDPTSSKTFFEIK